MLQGWVLSNLETMFTDVNDKVGTIAGEVSTTPSAWNSGIFNMIKTLSENVIVPIAGMIISFVLIYELITMVIDKNNMHDFDTSLFFRFLFKACIAVMLLSKTFDIVMAVFDVGSHVVTQAAASISGSTSLDVEAALTSMFNSQIDTMGIGELIGLGLETMVISLCMKIMSVLITVILYGRMIEIYLYVSVAPIPGSDSYQPGMGHNRDKLFKGAYRTCVSGVLHHGMRGNLRSAGGKCRSGGQFTQCIVVGSGIHRNPLFQFVQDRLIIKIYFQCPLSTKNRAWRALPTKGADYGNFSTSAERPEWNQDKSCIEPYQKADYLFFRRCPCGRSLILPYKRGIGDAGGGTHHGGRNAAILLFGNV